MLTGTVSFVDLVLVVDLNLDGDGDVNIGGALTGRSGVSVNAVDGHVQVAVAVKVQVPDQE